MLAIIIIFVVLAFIILANLDVGGQLHLPHKQQKGKCAICGKDAVVPDPEAERVPMSLINPRLIGLTLPIECYCTKCNARFRLKDSQTAEYEPI